MLVTEVRKSNCGVALGKSPKSDHPKGKEQHCVVNDSVVCQKRKKPTLPGANNSSYQLPTGKKSYMFFVSMMEHQRATNQPNSKPECVKCGTVYDTWDQLGRHMRIKGHDTNCPRCPDRQFDRWPDYQKHLKEVHNGKTLHRCKFCAEVCEGTDQWEKHLMRIHDKGFKCNECDMVFSTQSKRSSHKYRKHAAQVMCHDCGRTYPRNKQTRHILWYHTPNEKRPFQCLLCDPVKGFTTQQAYDDHYNIHTGDKCDQCPDVAYASSGNLFAHIRATHKGKKRKPKAKKKCD